MKEIMQNILNSFNTNKSGYSSRKLTAFIIVLMVVITHIKWLTLGNLTQLEMVLTIDYSFIAALFGMTTYQALKSSKNKEENKEDISETPSEDIGSEDK
jgi:hypothetical protein